MNTFEKADFLRNYLKSIEHNEYVLYNKGWYEILNLHRTSNNLSYEFMLEVEKEIDSIYELICEPNKVEKEKRIPALHTKATLNRFFGEHPSVYPYTRHFLRVNDDSEEGFTDYVITHHDLEIMILDSSAEFVQNENGNFLDYTLDSMLTSLSA